MKTVFINVSLRPDSKRRQLPVGLGYVMNAAKKAGFEFDLIDMDINHLEMRDMEEALSKKTYDVYAVGCIVTGFRLVRQIADIVKKANPAAVIIAGNSVATSIPEVLLRNTKVDIAVMGEADVTIVELLRALDLGRPISKVKGIAFKEGNQIVRTPNRPLIADIDTVGFPDWGIFELDKYDKYGYVNANVFSSKEVLSYPLNSARGCPFNCTFCYHVFKGQKYRRYSDEAIIGEIKRLHDSYGCNYVSFWDELTFASIKSVENFIGQLRGLNFKIGWQATTRGNLFKSGDLESIKEMKDLGCENIAFSLENASPEILAAMNKHMDVSQFVEQSKVLWKGGVVPLTSVIFGYPQETPETIQRTLDICEECNIYPSVGFLLPLPGTPIYEWARQNGYITDDVEYLEGIGDRQDFYINLTKMSDEEFVNITETGLRALAKKLGLKMESVFKTVTYQKPERRSQG